MNVGDLVRALEAIAPLRFAASWDNVGLIVGSEASPLSRVLLTIDCTAEVLDEAQRVRAEAIVSYHPPIFAPQKRFVAGSIAYDAARAGIAIHSPHTALDVADGGTNDVLADVLSMAGREPLRTVEGAAEGDRHSVGALLKLVTFVPAEAYETVSHAVFAAGAGRIGAYSSCGFRAPGTGSFFGGDGVHPVVGQPGRFEECAELRFETVVPASRLLDVVRALREAHPYEEPAFDLVRLAAPPGKSGLGRVGAVAVTTVSSLVARLKSALGIEHVLVGGRLDREVARVAVCAGSGGDLVPDAIAAGAELLVTGELRHHDVLRATAAGLTVVCVLHSASERVALVGLERGLVAALAGISVVRSAMDREPLTFA